MATLAHNLASRRSSVRAKYPNITIYWIGDPTHQSETSDHNPDSRSIVHALDFMTYTNTTQGNEIVSWLLSDTRDLEYVIFNRTIWSRSNGFMPKTYTGSNPHTDHVHTSGKHGSVGENTATGTGYDTEAEKLTPEGMDMSTADDVWRYNFGSSQHPRYAIDVLKDAANAPSNAEVQDMLNAAVAGLITQEQALALIQAVNELKIAVENSTGAAGNYDAVLTRRADS